MPSILKGFSYLSLLSAWNKECDVPYLDPAVIICDNDVVKYEETGCKTKKAVQNSLVMRVLHLYALLCFYQQNTSVTKCMG